MEVITGLTGFYRYGEQLHVLTARQMQMRYRQLILGIGRADYFSRRT
jgi:hypothetical protein